MTLEFDLSKEDFVHYNKHFLMQTESWQQQRRRIMVFNVIAMPLLLGAFAGYYLESIPIAAVIAAVWMALMFFWTPRLWEWEIDKTIQRMAENPGLGPAGTHRLTIRDDGLHETTPIGESRCPWKSIHRLEETAEYAFIFVGPNQAAVLPKRMGADRVQAFVDEVRRRAAAVRTTPEL